MNLTKHNRRRRITPTIAAAEHPNGHALIAVDAWLPGACPTDAEIELTTGPAYRTRFWRCRACGAERSRPDDFDAVCPGGRRDALVTDGGHAIEDAETERALAAELDVNWVTFGPGYVVEEGDGTRYVVDVDAETCRCDPHREEGGGCEHLRRADHAIRTGELPGPDGSFEQ